MGWVTGMDYKKAGVDVEKADRLVDWLQSSRDRNEPWADNVLGGIGGFASLFRLPTGFQKPVLVSSTDGVGTKVQVAAKYGQLDGIGFDLVAMCVNDLLCMGATPLFFLDYYAVGQLNEAAFRDFLTSLRSACREARVALVGGETAEMPGTYQPPDFDCAGFVVGIVDESKRWGPERVSVGDRLIAVASSGFHSNGYSLLRRLFAEDMDLWKDTLLRPTRIYTALVEAWRSAGIDVKSAAHITGGGMDNLPRALGPHQVARLRTWDWPAEFLEVQRRSGLSTHQMLTTLNCGIGFVGVVGAGDEARALKSAEAAGFSAWSLGTVESCSGEPDWQLSEAQ